MLIFNKNPLYQQAESRKHSKISRFLFTHLGPIYNFLFSLFSFHAVIIPLPFCLSADWQILFNSCVTTSFVSVPSSFKEVPNAQRISSCFILPYQLYTTTHRRQYLYNEGVRYEHGSCLGITPLVFATNSSAFPANKKGPYGFTAKDPSTN